MRSNNVLKLVLSFVALLLLISQTGMAATAQCQRKNEVERWGMPGGYSSPHDPTAEDLFLLHKVWFEATSKCSHIPKEFEKVKVCSVSKQVVAGMNYAFMLEDHDNRTFKLVVYVPLPQGSQGSPEQVTSCAMIQNPTS